jgi:hypothetical protein
MATQEVSIHLDLRYMIYEMCFAVAPCKGTSKCNVGKLNGKEFKKTLSNRSQSPHSLVLTMS